MILAEKRSEHLRDFEDQFVNGAYRVTTSADLSRKRYSPNMDRDMDALGEWSSEEVVIELEEE